MSGLEVAGVVLGTFPLIVSGLEQWHNIAQVGGFFWRIRKEYNRCRRDVRFHELVYKRNLRELLRPVVTEADELDSLVQDAGGQKWRSEDMQSRLETRLQEAHGLYMDIINDMNETGQELKEELSFNEAAVQDKLALPDVKQQQRPKSPQASARPSRMGSTKSKLEYEMFRAKFSLRESVRGALLERLKECNERLEKLLGSSDKLSSVQNPSESCAKQLSAQESVLRKAWNKSDQLFQALYKAWGCSCKRHHIANLRLEHRTFPDICFELILMFMTSSGKDSTFWSWEELQCGPGVGCSFPQKSINASNGPQPTARTETPARRKKVAFADSGRTAPKSELDTSFVDPSIKLCSLLGRCDGRNCMGIIGHRDEMYHLHPIKKWRRPSDGDIPLTLERILSPDFENQLSRRQRYYIALLLASTVAQLQFTPWLQTGLTKNDVFFYPCERVHCHIPYGELFIRQSFSLKSSPPNTETSDCNFYSLGILLLELCFGKRLEDHPSRRKHPAGDERSKPAFDLMAALKWSNSVEEEGGEDYMSAVKWCFTDGSNASQSWRSEIVQNVIRPLELCQEHFKASPERVLVMR